MPTAARSQLARCSRCGEAVPDDAVFCPRDGTRVERDAPEASLGGDGDGDPRVGRILDRDITLLAVAGTGSMGKVYRAHQASVDRDVAVKILHRELSGNLQLVQRFHREAKIASKLHHPHVVQVFFTGELPDGSLYIVMEYLDGTSLAAAIPEGGALELPRALGIMMQICDAVGEAHALGIVHRDLKPENVMLVRRAEQADWVKVLDFGIAKVSVGEQSMETAAGLIFGTARYLSPEAAQGAPIGPPGDVYALATILYQLLAGATPFDAERPVGLLVKHLHEVPPDLLTRPLARSVPRPIADVIMAGLAKDPAMRAPTARAFAADLARAAREAHVQPRGAGVASRPDPFEVDPPRAVALDPTFDDRRQPPSSSSDSAEAPPSLGPPEPQKRVAGTWQLIAIVTLALLLGAAVAVIVLERLSHQRDRDHEAYVARTRKALVESRYVEPPGDNVRDLVATGLVRWPDDPDFAQLRSDAAHEMVTRSMAARSMGDLGGAKALADEAAELDPTDVSAHMLVAQYSDELDALDAGVKSGAPRVFFQIAKTATPGERIPIDLRIVPGAETGTVVTEATLVVFDNGRPREGRPVALANPLPLHLRATLVAPAQGSYDVIFEAKIGGRPVRAERDLNVIAAQPAGRSPAAL